MRRCRSAYAAFACAPLACVPLACVLLAASPLRAQSPDHPPFMPTRDVSVVYDVQPEGAPSPQRITVSFTGDGRMMRIDAPGGQGSTILDRDKKLMTIVINGAKVFMQVPEREELRSPFLLDGSMKFAATGKGHVAGLDCATWSITASSGNATACVTADGVVLSQSGVDAQGVRGHIMAERVTYAPLVASSFQPPADYKRVAHPEGPAPYARSVDGPPTGPMTGPMDPAGH